MTFLRYHWPALRNALGVGAILFLFAVTALAQTVAVSGAAWPDDGWSQVRHRQWHQQHEVSADEVIDVWITFRDGSFAIAATSTRGEPPGEVVASEPRGLSVTAFDKKAAAVGGVWPGCALVARSGSLGAIRRNQSWSEHVAFLDWYLADMPAGADDVPEAVLAKLASQLAKADYFEDEWAKTTQQGSPRMIWGEWPPALAWRYAVDLDYGRLNEWTDRQLEWRAVHWRESHDTLLYEESPYTRKIGTVPLWAFDRQHFTATQILLHAVLTDDPIAWKTANAHARAIWSQAHHGKFDTEENLRAFGWPLEYLALHHAATGDARDVVAARRICERLYGTMQSEPTPWPVVNAKARLRNDHAYMGVSTWMLSRIAIAVQLWDSLDVDLGDQFDELRDICELSLLHARTVIETDVDWFNSQMKKWVPKGRTDGAWASDYDAHYPLYDTAWAVRINLHPDEVAPPAHDGKVWTIYNNPTGSYATTQSIWRAVWRSALPRDDVLAAYARTNSMRVSDKHADIAGILRYGPVGGWR